MSVENPRWLHLTPSVRTNNFQIDPFISTGIHKGQTLRAISQKKSILSWIIFQKCSSALRYTIILRKCLWLHIEIASIFISSLHIFLVYLLHLQSQGFQLGFPWKVANVPSFWQQALTAYRPGAFLSHFEKRENNVTLCYIQWERKEETNRKHKQDRKEDRMRQRHRWGPERDSKGKKRGKGIGFVMTVSSPMAGKMCVHMLQ